MTEELSEKKKGIEELLDKIPAEKRWAITAKTLTYIIVLRGDMSMPPLFSKGEGIIAPVLGLEKYLEINTKIWGDGGRQLYSMLKDMFNLPADDAIGAANLTLVCAISAMGPEFESERIEESPERVIGRTTKCVWMERYKELEVDPAFIPCVQSCPAWNEEGLKAVNPKLIFRSTTQMPRGDPYCEMVHEYKDE